MSHKTCISYLQVVLCRFCNTPWGVCCVITQCILCHQPLFGFSLINRQTEYLHHKYKGELSEERWNDGLDERFLLSSNIGYLPQIVLERYTWWTFNKSNVRVWFLRPARRLHNMLLMIYRKIPYGEEIYVISLIFLYIKKWNQHIKFNW